MDLREYKQFDLAKWMAGEERATPSMILAMLRDLPAGSRLQALTYGQREAPEPGSEIDWYLERRQWADPERQLMAAQLNTLSNLLRFVPQWKNGKAPEIDVVGPPEWRGITEQSDEKKKEPATIEDALAVFGWVRT